MTVVRTPWASAFSDIAISNDEVHVWRASLDVPPPSFESLRRTLSPDDLRRAERFRFARDGARFVAGRGLLRTILGGYVGVTPERLEFRYNGFGKPALRPIPGAEDLAFNLAHSNAVSVVAVARGRAVGIDVERIDRSLASDELARSFFSRREIEELRRLPVEIRRQAFFHCWTCKEAYVKARGDGLSLPLGRFHVRADPRQPPGLLGNDTDPRETQRWSFVTLAASGEYRAALVVEGHDCRVRFLQWPEHACRGEEAS